MPWPYSRVAKSSDISDIIQNISDYDNNYKIIEYYDFINIEEINDEFSRNHIRKNINIYVLYFDSNI